jgi:stage II sporulation protein D
VIATHDTTSPRGKARRGAARRRLALFGCLLCALVPAASARAEVTWEVTGSGWGHGIGMSQWGAFGYAKHGKSWKKILHHYYRHTKLGKAKGGNVRVLLQAGPDSVDFTDATRACGKDLEEQKTYTAVRDGSSVHLRSPDGQDLGGCGDSLQATGGEAVRVIDKGTYRGTLVILPRDSGGLYVINAVSLEGYVKGVLPNEMPTDWPANALRAQAVAARSYGLATGAGGGLFDQYDDTRSQVYGGIGSETAASNQAVKATAGKVVKHGGKVATTFYFSTSGGRTENIEFSFVGADPKPYLKSVKDPFEDASPYHRWKQTYSQDQMESKLGDLVQGSLQSIDVTKRGRSPRIVSAKVVGSGGTTTVSGPTLQSRLGLRSTWAFFNKTGS